MAMAMISIRHAAFKLMGTSHAVHRDTYSVSGPDTSHDTHPVHTRHMHKCLDLLNYSQDNDRAKSAYSRIALIERGLSAVAASANRNQLGNMEAMAAAAACRTGLGCAQAQTSSSDRAHTVTRQPRPARSSTRESNESSQQPRPGVEPDDPQHEAEGWTRCPQGRENSASDAKLHTLFTTVKVKAPPK